MSSLNLYENNSIIVKQTLTNPLKIPQAVNDASVKLTILDKNEDPVEGETWPVTMDYVADSAGVYSVAILDLPSIIGGKKYYILIDVLGSDGLIGQFKNEVIAQIKTN